MFTREETERVSKVGPGTPAGELLRRYWYPVAFEHELSEEKPTHFVRVLGEDLVLFRDKSGGVGLIADHCSHRGASMMYGRVEERGISCAYHGWLYDTKGNCLETPAEPEGSMFHLTVKQRAYPVQKLAGLYWAYLGPTPVPEIPHFDILFRRDGHKTTQLRGQLASSYFQAMENSVDPAHLQILHQATAGGKGRVAENTTRGFTDDVIRFDFFMTDYGIMKHREYKDGRVDEHPLIFPNILRQGNGMEIRVPVDDTHFNIYEVRFLPTPDGELVPEDDPVVHVPQTPHKTPMDKVHPEAVYSMAQVDHQDYMVWETQGGFADRTVERLATTDRGVVMLRNLFLEQIALVEKGGDPMGVQRDPNHPIIDTNLTHSLIVEAGLLPASAEGRR